MRSFMREHYRPELRSARIRLILIQRGTLQFIRGAKPVGSVASSGPKLPESFGAILSKNLGAGFAIRGKAEAAVIF